MDLKKQEIEDYYQEHLDSNYQPAFYQPRYHQVLKLLAADKKSIKILDIGCGAGDLLLMIKEAGFLNIEGLDYSLQAQKFAQSRGLKVTLGDLEQETPKFNYKFDVVVCADTLEHVFDPGKFLERIKPLLTNRGKLILTVPNAGWYLNGFLLTFFPRFLRLSPAFGVWTHCNQFTVYTLNKLLTASGFRTQKTLGVSFIRTPAEHENFIRKLLKIIAKLPIKFSDLFVT